MQMMLCHLLYNIEIVCHELKCYTTTRQRYFTVVLDIMPHLFHRMTKQTTFVLSTMNYYKALALLVHINFAVTVI